ncbi:hypothetical protein CTI10_015275 [Delftia acidovorans]|nr:hypothetical protein CTI10_015275 [Delftia acidovorans]
MGAKQKRLPREAASVSATTTGETTVNQTNSLAHLGAAPARGVSALHAAAQAQPVSQVEAALSNIDAGMEDLQNTIRRISGRLEPVLSAAGVSAEGSAHEAEPASPTPLVRRLNAMATQLRESCAALQDMERRLAL